MKACSLKSLVLMGSALMITLALEVNAGTPDYSNALARNSCPSGRCARNSNSLKPYRVQETHNPEVTEEELLLQLNPAARHIYQRLDEEHKAMARELASDRYRYDKNHAVQIALEKSSHKNAQNH